MGGRLRERCSSFKRAGGIGAGARINKSCACWFSGKAMTSRILGVIGQKHDDAVNPGCRRRREAVRHI